MIIINKMNTFLDILDKGLNLYEIIKPLYACIKNKINEKAIDTSIGDIANDTSGRDVCELMKDSIASVLAVKNVELKADNYTEIFNAKFAEDVAEEMINNDSRLGIIKKDIIDNVENYRTKVIEFLAAKAGDKQIYKLIIELNDRLERNENIRTDKIISEIIRNIYSVKNEIEEKSKVNSNEDILELPFELENLAYDISLEEIKGYISHSIQFTISKKNYKVDIEDIYVVTEAKSGKWIFDRETMFLLNGHTTNQKIIFHVKKENIRSVASSGIVAFIKVYNRKEYYIRIFGDLDNLYYEELTIDEYIIKRNEYKLKYNKANALDAGYSECREYAFAVLYTNFT